MAVNPITATDIAIQKHNALMKIENRHMELVVEQRHIKKQLEDNEQKRIEANQRMNRAGQNVDKLA